MCVGQSTEIEPAEEESAASRSALVQALQTRITALEREIRDSDNTHRLRYARYTYIASLMTEATNW